MSLTALKVILRLGCFLILRI